VRPKGPRVNIPAQLGLEQLQQQVPRVNEAAGSRVFGHTAYIGNVAPDGTLADLDTLTRT
jgi:hypothetical protein